LMGNVLFTQGAQLQLLGQPLAAAALQHQTIAAEAGPVADTTVALHSCTPAVHTTLKTTHTHSPNHQD
jgi:hypothetical protein